MELKFRKYRIVIIVLLAILSPVLPYALITGTTLNLNDRFLWSLFFGILITATILLIWYALFTQILKIGINGNTIYSENLITKKKQQFTLSEETEIKNSVWNSTINIQAKQRRISINPELYSNVAELIEEIKTVANND